MPVDFNRKVYEPTTELLFDGNRIVFSDFDGESVWFTKEGDGLVVETENLWLSLTAEQLAALRDFLK